MTQTSYPLHKIKVVLLENIHQRAADLLLQEGYSVERRAEAPGTSELIDLAGDAHILGIRSRTKITEEFLDQAKRLWAIGCFCIGTNQVDLQAAADRGIVVFNAPFSNTRSVAEVTISEIIALHRSLFDRSRSMHEGRWRKSASGAHEVRGRTLGIVGYGRIGSQLSVLAEILGMRVIFYDIVDRLPMGNASPVSSLDELLAESDIVTLHVPATPTTRRMIGAEQLKKMREGSYLINNARGDVVDHEALREAIESGHLAGAAIDVFPKEPTENDSPFQTPLAGLPNVILTPHIAGSTQEAQRNIAEEVGVKLGKFMNNGSTTTAVNFPEVELPVLHPEQHRILHYHRNVPGVLSKMHKIIADVGVNISAEYLQSNAQHSYMILDVDPGSDKEVLDGLRAIPETVRVRTLW